MTAKKNTRHPSRAAPTVLSNINPFSAAQDAILEQADAFGWRLLDYYIAEEIIPTEPPPIGAIVHDLPDSPLVGRLHQQGIPVVRLGAYPHPQDHKLPAVLPDIAAPGRLAADHFAARQFRNIAYIGHHP